MNFCKFIISVFCIVNVSIHAAPTISLHFEFNFKKTTSLLHPPYLSAVVNDNNDPAFAKGIIVSIFENDKPVNANEYQIKAISSNNNVVTNNDILIGKNNGEATIKIKPLSSGYSNITLTLNKDKNTEELIIYYSASLIDTKLKTYYHTGFSDASAAIAIDDNYMIVGDDENNVLCIYNRNYSGLPFTVFNYEKYLNSGDEQNKEIDCEAAVRSVKSKNIIYWTGSMGNGGKKFEEKPNRSNLLATELTGAGKEVKFVYKGSYTELRKQLIKWGDKNGYKFSTSSAYGEKPKQLSGFNVEGMVFAPDSLTLYIAFRAPLVPITNRKKALLAPIKDFENWFSAGHASNKINIDKPIELDLGGRGFRDIIQLSNAQYLIVAGNSDETKNAALYLWSGIPDDIPTWIPNNDISNLNIEAAIEITEAGKYTGKVQLLCDDGSTTFYNDGISAKYLTPEFKKFRSIIISIKP